jgi:tetratricopeptide (TPR) repeat protein
MSAQVFLSFASGDQKIARSVYDALYRKGVSTWFAPVDVLPGEIFSKKIADAIPQCRVFLLLWSKHASASEHVGREIAIAAEAQPKLLLVPVRLDETPRENYYLKRENWTWMRDLGHEGVARSIEQHLRVADAPYPLGGLYQEIQKCGLDFDRHLHAIRLLVRFVALVHTAGYIRLRDRSDDLDRQIEKLFTLDSVFADFDVARGVNKWLDDHGAVVHDGFRGFFKLPCNRLPGTHDYENDDLAADAFDKKHLYKLCNIKGDLVEGSTVSPEEADENLCRGIREFMRQALTQEWSTVCELLVSVDGSDRRRPVGRSIVLTEGEAAGAKLCLNLPTGTFDLDPFFSLIRSGAEAVRKVAFLRGQDDFARFTPISTQGCDPTDLPPIVLPWRRVEIIRTLPKIAYVAQVHSVGLRLTNNTSSDVHIRKIEEQLPDNLISSDGQTTVSVATGLALAAGETRVLEYQIQGANLPGAKRSFSAGTIAVSYQNDESTSPIEGDHEVLVQMVPAATLIVTRRLLTRQGGPVGARVFLDSELTVEVVIRSGGAGLASVRLEEEIGGAVLIAGDQPLYSGAIDRADRQQPILASYQLRITGPDVLTIRMRATCGGDPVHLEEAESRLEVDNLPPPRLALRWKSVVRDGPDQLDACLQIGNTGGTAAYGLDIHIAAPENVTVSLAHSPTPERLEVGADRSVLANIVCPGVPSGSVRLTAHWGSIGGAKFEEGLTLDLHRVIETNIAAIPVLGRLEAREEIRRALTDPAIVILNLHGERGAGKRHLLRGEIDRLQQTEGREIAQYEFDCGIADSFAGAIATLLQRMIDAETLEKDRGSDQARTEFLNHVGMGEHQYNGYIAQLESLNREGKPSHGAWAALALLLTKIANAKKVSPLVVLLRGVSRFGKAELEGLTVLRQYLQPPVAVRVVVSTYDALKMTAVDREIQVGPLSDEDCKEFIGRVFVMPGASHSLQRALIDKSEKRPADLISLLRRLIEKSDSLLDFSTPAGARVRDASAFRDLPTSLVESERKAAESSEIPSAVLACLAAIREPVTADRVRKILQKIDEDQSEASLGEFLAECKRHHWLQGPGKKPEIRSASVREALSEAVPRDMLERVHQAIYTLYEEERRSPEDCFQHLVEAPVEFIDGRGPQLTSGLRTLISNGSYTQVRTILNRLRTAGFAPDIAGKLELSGIEQELQLEETGDLDPQEIEALLQKLRTIPNRYQRDMLNTRLCLLASEWHYCRENYAKAAAVAESVEHNWPFRRLSIRDPRLEFEFYLNLWTIYYQLLDENNFARVDRWIWKRLATQKDGRYDSYMIARFLGQFLEFQLQFPSLASREEHFPVVWVRTLNELRPARANQIEVLTKTERIAESFLNEFLKKPDKLNQANVLVLGRLYLHLGATRWAEAKTRSVLSGRTSQPNDASDADAESYLLRAETLFAEGGFILDLANARATIGNAYLDRLRLAKETVDKQQAVELCSLAAQWLKRAADDFEAVDAAQRASDTWESYADVVGRWAGYQRDVLMEAIHAYERLIGLHALSGRSEKLDAWRLTLVELYKEAGRLESASRILDEMEVQSVDVLQLRALIHAESLVEGTTSITPRNEAEFRRDLESLRSAPPTAYTSVGPGWLQLSSSTEAIGVIAWNLANFHAAAQRATPALQILRESRSEIVATSVLAGPLRTTLPILLPALWQMEGSADDRMTQDFSNLLLPLVNSALRPAVEQMLERVSEWESSRSDGTHLAAADMSLVLCEWSLEHGQKPEAEKAPAQRVFQDLRSRNIWDSKAIARMLARALTVMLRAGAGARSERVLLEELPDLLNDLKSRQLYSASLWVMVHLIEMLLDVYRTTQQSWHFTVINKLAVQLGPLQELSENDFEDATRLISLYLQLPNRVTDAVDLMEKQCQHLLAQRDYRLLPRYLSFLSDLLGDVLRQDQVIAQLLSASEEESERAVNALQTVVESKRTTALKEVATDLCVRIISEVQRQRTDRSSESTLLYNAAKLLSGHDTADLQAAVYVKLYDLADEVDGSCVWAVYNAWTERAPVSANLSLEDGIALTTYSNCREEATDGEFQGSPRNYLINARARNLIIRELMTETPGHLELLLAFGELEIQRFGFLIRLIDGLQQYLQGQDEFERMEWVTFLYGYLLPTDENAPFWQKLQRIENQRKQFERAISILVNDLGRHGVFSAASFSKHEMQALSYRVQQFIVSNRARGREIMNQLTERIRPFSLGDILGEVQHQLEGRERRVDFGAVLGLRADGQGGDSQPSFPMAADAGAFLNRDPSTLVKPLLTNGSRLLQQNEPALAERLYRFALSLCQTPNGEEVSDLSTILHGLTQSLADQGKLEEARDLALREVELRSAKADPELGAALDQLAHVLKAGGRPEEAIPYLRRKLEIDRASLKPEDFASKLRGFAQFLRGVGHGDESDTLARKAEAILRDVIDCYEKASGLESPDTLRAVGTLATLLDEAGRQSESRVLHMRQITAISSKEDASPWDARGAALSCVLIGNYQLAESLLRRILNSGFEVASTYCHLARVMMLINREHDARSQIEQARMHLEEAEDYVFLRVLWFEVLFALLDGKDPDVLLRSINEVFEEKGSRTPWTIAPVLEVVRPRLKPDDFVLLNALAAALDDKKGVEGLTMLSKWRSSQTGKFPT